LQRRGIPGLAGRIWRVWRVSTLAGAGWFGWKAPGGGIGRRFAWIRIGDIFAFRKFSETDIAGGAIGIFGDEEGRRDGFGVVERLGGYGLWLGGGDGDGFGAAGFEELVEGGEFALEGTFGGGFVTEMEVVSFDFQCGPIERGARTDGAEEIVKIAMGADTTPFGLGGFVDEIVFEGIRGRLVFGEPAAEETVPVFFRFDTEDEGLGAATVF
jgi:hypothetical protein